MKASVLVGMITGLALAGSMVAQSAKEVKRVPVTPTRADSGVEMFKTYCRGCHGVDGKGEGPAASALKVPAADLTMLKQKNGGKFPAAKVSHVLEGADVLAHGGTDMPLWGPIFRSLDPGNAALAKLRIANVLKYLESIQK